MHLKNCVYSDFQWNTLDMAAVRRELQGAMYRCDGHVVQSQAGRNQARLWV